MIALDQQHFDPTEPVHSEVLDHERQNEILEIRLAHIPNAGRCQLGTSLSGLVGATGVGLGILFEPLYQPNDRVDLTSNSVVRDNRLLAQIEGFDLLGSPLGAVAVSTRFLLLVDLCLLVVQVIVEASLAPLKRPKVSVLALACVVERRLPGLKRPG